MATKVKFSNFTDLFKSVLNMFNLESMEKKHCLSNNIRIIHISLIDFEQEFEKHQKQAV